MPKKVTDIGTIYQRTYSDSARALRSAEAGLAWEPMGAIASAKDVVKHSTLMFYNADSVVHFVKFSDDGSAPSTGADGLPVPPGQIVRYSAGDADCKIRSDSAQVFAYLADKDE